jgi:hypothetical protein
MIWLVVAEALAIVVLSWKMYGALCRLESLDADVALMQRERVAYRRRGEIAAPWGPSR